ncbi:MAG: fructose-bisphosphate aldolase, class [Solirubrobacteraceae bacterium]|jgi:class I fructose-bisphosphate aldolase|nr:fructose-bisphosphate aldolase, class [Solirubrobacteraceae bacterium]
MGRIFGADGRTLVLPVDHGLTLGRVEGLEDPVGRVDGLLDLPCDGLLMTPGLTRLTADRFAHRGAPARLLTLDTFFRAPGEQDAGTGLAGSVEQAAALGVDCVKLFMAWNVPSRERAATVARIAEVIRRAGAFDLPVMVEPIVVGEPRTDEAIAIEGDAARAAMEAGADIIKVAYPGPELMAAWSAELHVPLVILGGPRTGEADAVLTLAEEAVEHGARGIVIGRNVWQRPPDVTRRLMQRLHEIVHGSGAADDLGTA